MPRGNQLARQWQLLQLIDQPAGIAVDDAARKLDCTVRTIWRDLSALQKAGFPLYDDKGADGRRSLWKLEEQFTLGLPVKLSLAETAALVMSRELLTSAFDKIGRVLSRDAPAPPRPDARDHRRARRRRQSCRPRRPGTWPSSRRPCSSAAG